MSNMTIFEFKDAVTELTFGKLSSNDTNQTPYEYEDVLDRLRDMLATQTLILPITQCDVDDYFTPLVQDGITFDWDFDTEDGTPVNVQFTQ